MYHPRGYYKNSPESLKTITGQNIVKYFHTQLPDKKIGKLSVLLPNYFLKDILCSVTWNSLNKRALEFQNLYRSKFFEDIDPAHPRKEVLRSNVPEPKCDCEECTKFDQRKYIWGKKVECKTLFEKIQWYAYFRNSPMAMIEEVKEKYFVGYFVSII
jgi:hypothetical protein